MERRGLGREEAMEVCVGLFQDFQLKKGLNLQLASGSLGNIYVWV